MPASIVIKLRAVTKGTLLNSNGLILHAIWYNKWAEGDPNKEVNKVMKELAEKLHHKNDENRPFTISPLMNLNSDDKGICHFQIGQQCWFRITSLTDELTSHLSLWINKVKKSCIEMEKSIWYIERVYEFSDEHEWAGQISYAGIERIVQKDNHNSLWTLEFTTPMSLKGSKFMYPFPQPESLVKSWRKKWITFAPESAVSISEDVIKEIRENLSIERYQLRTETIKMRGQPFPACKGMITFKDHGMSPESRQALNLLMHFSFFCGSGYKTTQGLGQTRLIQPK